MKRSAWLVVILLLICSTAWAQGMGQTEEWFESGDYSYYLNDDGSATICDYRGEEERLVVPDMLDGCAVTAIGDNAFESCHSLMEIVLPEGLMSIGSDPFINCVSLEKVVLPDSLTELKVNPFGMCEELSVIQISETHPTMEIIDGVLFSKTDRRIVCYPMDMGAEIYTVPEGTKIIGNKAFGINLQLKEVILPDSVRTIDRNAFSNCKKLERITLSEGLTSIGYGAFQSCFCLAEITLPEGLEEIGATAFADCTSLTEIVIPESTTTIGNWAFRSSAIRRAVIPAGVMEIGLSLFEGCEEVTVTVEKGSLSEEYCQNNELAVIYGD